MYMQHMVDDLNAFYGASQRQELEDVYGLYGNNYVQKNKQWQAMQTTGFKNVKLGLLSKCEKLKT